jgi:hypothetical protein
MRGGAAGRGPEREPRTVDPLVDLPGVLDPVARAVVVPTVPDVDNVVYAGAAVKRPV